MKTNIREIIPFRGRNTSGSCKVNFTYEFDEKVFVTDNHMMALWLWNKNLENSQTYNVLHIDEHYDCMPIKDLKEEAQISKEDFDTLSINEYLDTKRIIDNTTVPLFTFDNYFYRYITMNPGVFRRIDFFTHGIGTKPDFQFNEYKISELLNYMNDEITESNGKWVINIDIDYFVCDRTGEEGRMQMVTDEFLIEFGESVKQWYKKGKVATCIIALSPEYAGGWSLSEKIAKLILNGMEYAFDLPHD